MTDGGALGAAIASTLAVGSSVVLGAVQVVLVMLPLVILSIGLTIYGLIRQRTQSAELTAKVEEIGAAVQDQAAVLERLQAGL